MTGFIVKQYPGLGQPADTPVLDLAQHGSFGEAQIDVFGRAARWADGVAGRTVSAPEDDNGRASTAICWQDGIIELILAAEKIGA